MLVFGVRVRGFGGSFCFLWFGRNVRKFEFCVRFHGNGKNSTGYMNMGDKGYVNVRGILIRIKHI